MTIVFRFLHTVLCGITNYDFFVLQRRKKDLASPLLPVSGLEIGNQNNV